ncbi:MAG: N-acetylmuramoyl-L-alanine amidase, partial [Oscillospiraceae bacterium]|nr:N-acetylmuramoyl-L-alanine amidase [Oscillospiraceae bacterium]
MMDALRLRKLTDCVLALLVLLAAALLIDTALHLQPTTAPEKERPCLVIDAGHGGIDGGAVAFNGVKESDINLAIASKLSLMADFYGQANAMTRVDDSRRTDVLSYSEHEDLVYRTELINAVSHG